MTSLFEPAPEPKTELGRLRILGKHAGIRVSPLALGAMSIGEAWKGFMGTMDKEQSFKLLDEFVDAGGNFVSNLLLKYAILEKYTACICLCRSGRLERAVRHWRPSQAYDVSQPGT